MTELKTLQEAWNKMEKGMEAKEADKKPLNTKVDSKKPVKEDAAGAGATTAGSAGLTLGGKAYAAKDDKSGVFADRLGKLKKKVEEGQGAVKVDQAQTKLATAIDKQATSMLGGADAPITEESPEEGMDGSVPDITDEVPGAEGAEGEVAPEEMEDTVTKILNQYPNAVITITVQLPEETPFDAETVAAAQEVVGDEEGLEGTDGVEEPLEEPAEEAPMAEKRKFTIKKIRKQIKEMFNNLGEEDEAAPEMGVDTPAEQEDAAAVTEPGTEPEAEELKPETEVTDSKIVLTPEQWEQVLVTNEMGAMGNGDEMSDAGQDVDATPEVDAPVDETKKVVAPVAMSESSEIAGYAIALNKIIKG